MNDAGAGVVESIPVDSGDFLVLGVGHRQDEVTIFSVTTIGRNRKSVGV